MSIIISFSFREGVDDDILQAIRNHKGNRSALIREWYEGKESTPNWAKQLLCQQQEILDRLNNGVSVNGKEEKKEEKVDLGGLFDD